MPAGRRRAHPARLEPTRPRGRALKTGGDSMSEVRVATFDGPGSAPVIRTVPRPKVGPKAALIRIGVCGVCGTDLHILKGHWPKPLPWPFTLGHELAGVVVEIGDELKTDFMGKSIGDGFQADAAAAHAVRPLRLVRAPPRDGQQVPNACLLRALSGLRQGAAPVGRLGGDGLRRLRGAARHQDLQAARRDAAAPGRADRAADLLHPRLRARAARGQWLRVERHRGGAGHRPHRHPRARRGARDGRGPRDRGRRAGESRASSSPAGSARTRPSTSTR